MTDKIFNAIAELIAERNDCDVSEITMDTNFQEIGIDSLDTVEMKTSSARRLSCRRRSRPSAISSATLRPTSKHKNYDPYRTL